MLAAAVLLPSSLVLGTEMLLGAWIVKLHKRCRIKANRDNKSATLASAYLGNSLCC